MEGILFEKMLFVFVTELDIIFTRRPFFDSSKMLKDKPFDCVCLILQFYQFLDELNSVYRLRKKSITCKKCQRDLQYMRLTSERKCSLFPCKYVRQR